MFCGFFFVSVFSSLVIVIFFFKVFFVSLASYLSHSRLFLSFFIYIYLLSVFQYKSSTVSYRRGSMGVTGVWRACDAVYIFDVLPFALPPSWSTYRRTGIPASCMNNKQPQLRLRLSNDCRPCASPQTREKESPRSQLLLLLLLLQCPARRTVTIIRKLTLWPAVVKI